MDGKAFEMRVSLLGLREAVLAVARELVADRRGDQDWRTLKEGTLWYELGACLLGSQVRYEHALMAARRLKAAGLLSRRPTTSEMQWFEREVARVLSQPSPLRNGQFQRYRFPRSRARLLRLAAAAIYSDGGSIRAILKAADCARKARYELVTNVPGIGPKQASLFLRNVGYAHDLAVLDVHVLRYMTWVEGVTVVQRPLQSLGAYEGLEHRFRCHAEELGIPVGRLDLAVWVTVRALIGQASL